MSNIAILVGNTTYQHLTQLDCCRNDVLAVKALIEATQKFDVVEPVIDADSSTLKDRIRAVLDSHDTVNELFFYFTGHGSYRNSEFYFCATDFDPKRPNGTGLSLDEFYTFVRSKSPELSVLVVDACNSGVPLIKAESAAVFGRKEGLKGLVQMASSLETQSSFTGDPLSAFTDKFKAAVLKRTEGPVYYGDIISALRDEFLNNTDQTPHFNCQGTQRETFVDDAKNLDSIRAPAQPLAPPDIVDARPAERALVPTVVEILQSADARYATKEAATNFIARLFGKIAERASKDLFKDTFNAQLVEHADYKEATSRAFIIRVLSGESRPDNFVTANITKEYKRRDPFRIGQFAMSMFGNEEDYVSRYELKLNCQLEKVQLKLVFTPKYQSLKSFVLVVSCAPSLKCCYVTEMMTAHQLRDWNVFDDDGVEVTRRWFKIDWDDPADSLVEQIFGKLNDTIQDHIVEAWSSLTKTKDSG